MTLPRWFDWLALVRVSKSVLEFRNLFVDVVGWVLYFLTMKLSWGNDCLIFVLVGLRSESPFFFFHFFKVEVNVERLFPLALTNLIRISKCPFFSNVSLVWSFCDSYCLALILIMVLKYMFRFFRFCLGRSWCGRDYVSYVLDTPVWVEFRNPVFYFSMFCFLIFTLKRVRKRLSRFGSDWFEFRKSVFLDI